MDNKNIIILVVGLLVISILIIILISFTKKESFTAYENEKLEYFYKKGKIKPSDSDQKKKILLRMYS